MGQAEMAQYFNIFYKIYQTKGTLALALDKFITSAILKWWE
jgi:hypothetical protein